MSALDTKHVLKSDWWLPYVKPSPTWETVNGYNVSLGLLRSKPPSADLEKEQVQAYLAGLLEGEGYFYYSRHYNGYFPCVYLRMCELAPVRFFSQVMNVTVTLVQRSYVSRVKGLRAVLLARIIGTMLAGKRRLTSELFVKRGYQVVSTVTLQDYRLIYGSAKQKLLMPTPLRHDDMERYPALKGRISGRRLGRNPPSVLGDIHLIGIPAPQAVFTGAYYPFHDVGWPFTLTASLLNASASSSTTGGGFFCAFTRPLGRHLTVPRSRHVDGVSSDPHAESGVARQLVNPARVYASFAKQGFWNSFCYLLHDSQTAFFLNMRRKRMRNKSLRK